MTDISLNHKKLTNGIPEYHTKVINEASTCRSTNDLYEYINDTALFGVLFDSNLLWQHSVQ